MINKPKKYSVFSLVRNALSYHENWQPAWRNPEIKKSSLADEALTELKSEQPQLKEENLEAKETPLELNEEVLKEEENKSE